ncbi:transient receptor potential cation channel subfamily V member 1-like [Fundulus heteroclitus]|uniref:transient receptor potential cation channel subfamily V member 1-like n=1 Tax=Fundulus heteroclitus TaxID=8078 RepID=UPI00165B68D8|nr:transient receptor potential cation channel subfamily V member 1-like [Fundulus heteroclitus]
MDSLTPLSFYNNVIREDFTKDAVFRAVSEGDVEQLAGLLEFLRAKDKRLSSLDFTDKTTGKTVLLKALLNLKDGRNNTVGVLLEIAEKTEDLETLINAAYTDPCYQGQTALHVAIERRSLYYVKLLVQKGADVQAKANGTFFQQGAGLGFYFGELPLSLAACTNQPEMVSFLMENPDRRADPTQRDSQGNTVLHILVVIADDSTENTEMVANMYDRILVQHYKLNKKSKVQLESIVNNEGLTPLKLAASLGKIGLLKHMLSREFMDESRRLSRKFTRWVYGPVRSSLYDIGSIDTDENNSVLEIIIFGSEMPNRPEMLQIEPLQSLLQNKWKKFASKLFLINFLSYMLYLVIFTSVAFYRKDGEPPFAINDPEDYLSFVGELIVVLGALRFLYKSITQFQRRPPQIRTLFTNGFSDILFFLQAVLLLLCAILYCSGCREYVGLLVLALALAWVSLLYYARGVKQLGIYNVMMQRMILGDLLHFLCIYSVLLFGFSTAVVALIKEPSGTVRTNETLVPEGDFKSDPSGCRKPGYDDMRHTMMELFKFTIGMGDLEFTDHVDYKSVFYILLICYIVLTYILMLNMLIALMGNTVERISEQSETIWNLQRAFAILDMERALPRWLKTKLHSRASETVRLKNDEDTTLRFITVAEMNWTKWRSDISTKLEEDPENTVVSQGLMGIVGPRLVSEELSNSLATSTEDHSLA